MNRMKRRQIIVSDTYFTYLTFLVFGNQIQNQIQNLIQNEKDYNLFSISECLRESEINGEDNEKQFIKIHPLEVLDTKENLGLEDNYYVNLLAVKETNESIKENSKAIPLVIGPADEKEKEAQMNIDEEIEVDMDDE